MIGNCPLWQNAEKDCDDDCMECMDFITTCDNCYVPGHTDSDGFFEQPDGRIFCWDCDKEAKQ